MKIENNSREQKVSLPLVTREAPFIPSTLDSEKRTVELVFTTGARALRFDWWDGEYFWEELSMDPAHVRMGRLQNGAPLLNSHQRFNLDDQIGVVEKASLKGNEGFATVRFAKDEKSDEIFQKVADKIVRNVSIGYNIYRMIEQEQVDPATGYKVFRAVDWEPSEISLVPVGADDQAKVRENSQKRNECILIRSAEGEPMKKEVQKEGETVKEEVKTEVVATEVKREVSADNDKVVSEATVNERRRISDIRKATKVSRLPEEFGQKLIDAGTEVSEARAMIMDEAFKRDEAQPTRSQNIIAMGDAPRDHFRAGMTNALLHRGNREVALTDVGKRYTSRSLLELARICVREMGVNDDGFSKMQLAAVALNMTGTRGLHGTSDFPEILANVAEKTLRAAYEAAPQTFLPFTTIGTLPDFKQVSRVQLGDAPALLKVYENGEVTRGTIGEGAEKYQLSTYARILGFTRQALINDDTDAFSRMQELMGRRAKDLESDLVWEQITSNPTMNDTVALFHSSHGNLDAHGAISVSTFGTGRKLMRLQTGLNGALTNLQAKYVAVPAAMESLAEQYLTLTSPNIATSVNPFAGRLQLIVEPRLDAADAGAWYMMADKGQIDMIELGYLEGEKGPRFESRAGFDVEGVEFKIGHDVGAKVLDYRGFVKNPAS